MVNAPRLALETLCVAFSMYSALPMPRIDWNARNMRYALCALPAVGLVTGGLLLALCALGRATDLGVPLRAAFATALPVLVTGGIHLDGFCDAADALASNAPREKKLEILKDPHLGAFGAMRCCLLLLVSFALWCRLSWTWGQAGVLALGFVLSRALSGLSVVAFPPARSGGLLALFASAAQKGAVRGALAALSLACAAGMALLSPLYGCAALAGAAVSLLRYHRRALRLFGGTTGDLAGHFLQSCECAMLLCCTLAEIGAPVIFP